MRNVSRQFMNGVVLSIVTVSYSHADFLNTLTQTMSQVQQAVESTKQAVDSTTQTVNGAKETIDSTKNTVEQATSQPASQPSATQPQNGAAIDKQALSAREAAAKAYIQKAIATLQDGYKASQFQQAIVGINQQWEAETLQVQQQFLPKIQKDPNNTALQSQYDAQTNAVEARKYDRWEQYCRDVETGKVQFKTAQARR